jgi:hypothetical protein
MFRNLTVNNVLNRFAIALFFDIQTLRVFILEFLGTLTSKEHDKIRSNEEWEDFLLLPNASFYEQFFIW